MQRVWPNDTNFDDSHVLRAITDQTNTNKNQLCFFHNKRNYSTSNFPQTAVSYRIFSHWNKLKWGALLLERAAVRADNSPYRTKARVLYLYNKTNVRYLFIYSDKRTNNLSFTHLHPYCCNPSLKSTLPICSWLQTLASFSNFACRFFNMSMSSMLKVICASDL